MTMITPSYLGETIEYSSLHACRSTLEDPTEIEKINQAGRAEIAAAERAGAQGVRAIAARLATERAAALIREQMNDAAEDALFGAFVGELERAGT